MKRNRAELSTMSVSALDVFASALGVFIILTSVSLPFIFNTSQSAAKNLSQAEIEAEVQSIIDPTEAIKRLLVEMIALRAEIEELQKLTVKEASKTEAEKGLTESLTAKVESLEQVLKLVEKNLEAALRDRKTTEMIPPIDIVIALDTTGSMQDELRSLQGGVIYLSRILMKWSESPAIGIVEIMDQCDYSRRKKFSLQEINAQTLGSLQRFVYSIGKMDTGCNSDQEEGIHLALREAVASSWRPNIQKRVIILMSDFPPYPYALGEVQRSIQSFSRSSNQTISIVHPVNSYSTPKHVSIMRNLAQTGKGQYIDGAGSIIGAIILAL
jgi:hypothetical protein|tara:strand:+ start:667 stop:1647 length:981 start_codon:yes stop_codon:yes gene_type:complete